MKQGNVVTQAQALMVEVDIQKVGEQFYASSQDVPGLTVCGDTREQACESAVAAMKYLFKRNRGVDVEIMPAAEDFGSFSDPVESCDRFVAIST